MHSCNFTFEALINYVEGHTDPITTQRIREHLETECRECHRRLAWIQTFVPALHRAVSEEMPDVPQTALNYARNIARAYPRPVPQPLLVRLASLVFDSRMPQPALGMRSGEGSEGQLVYSAEGYDIDLWQEPSGGERWQLMGQILPHQGGAPLSLEEALLLSAEGLSLIGQIESKEFIVRDVPAGSYEVRLRIPGEQIVMRDVLLGP